jgi:hypothetical protein
MSHASPPKIAVLIHARDSLESPTYLLSLLIDTWRRSGTEVMILRGTDALPMTDVLILHVDLTVIPQDYINFSGRYPVVINGAVHDISKRKISGNLVRADDTYQGAVIVKSDLNCGGNREFLHRSKLYQQASERVHRGWGYRLRQNEYPIYPSAAAVPRAVWRNPRLVVERFMPERRGDYYCLRQWVFLGDRELSQRVFSRDPIVKAHSVVEREYDVPVPDALRTIRSQLGFDYGKFDYVVFDGEVQLLDANRTPTVNPGTTSPRLDAIVDELAQGLAFFLAVETQPAPGQ